MNRVTVVGLVAAVTPGPDNTLVYVMGGSGEGVIGCRAEGVTAKNITAEDVGGYIFVAGKLVRDPEQDEEPQTVAGSLSRRVLVEEIGLFEWYATNDD